MRMLLVGSLIFVGLSQSSCGAPKDAGAFIAIGVSPEKAYIVPGKGVSCVSRATAKKDDTAPSADVAGDSVLFSNFSLQWKSGAKLTLSSLKATVYSSGIDGADGDAGLEIPISEDEFAALLGLSDLKIDFPSPYSEDRITTIDSSSAAGKASRDNPYAPCGLQLGGFAGKKGVKSFTARIKIEVAGFSTACVLNAETGVCSDGEQFPVRQTVTVRAERF